MMNIDRYISNTAQLLGIIALAIMPVIASAGSDSTATTTLSTAIALDRSITVDAASKTMDNSSGIITSNSNSQITLTVTDNSTTGYEIKVKGAKGYLDISGGSDSNAYKQSDYSLECNTELSQLQDVGGAKVTNSFDSATKIKTSDQTVFTHASPEAPTNANSTTCTVSATNLDTIFQGTYSDTLTFTLTAAS